MPSRALLLPLTALGLFAVAASHPIASPTYSDWSTPVNLGPEVNSPFQDAGPAISKNGLSLYFFSARPGGRGGTDIYVSRRPSVDAAWRSPVNLGETINSAFEERAPNLSRDGHWLFFLSNRPGGEGGDDLWVSWRAHTRDDFGWSAPMNLGPAINTPAGEASPAYLEDDDTGIPRLFFSSNRNAVPTLFDLYVSALGADGSFGPPEPVMELNSAQSEQGPAPRFDGLEIFFFSNRLGAVNGSQDLWVATRETAVDPWSIPVNLGSAINTGFNEVLPAISADRETLFFVSNRPGGFGVVDLYQSTRTKVAGQD